KASSALAPAILEFDEISGDLSGGLAIGSLRYSNAGTRLEAERVKLAVQFGLFPPQLQIDSPRIETLSLWTGAGESAPDQNGGLDLSDLAVPLKITIDSAKLNEFRYFDATGNELYRADAIGLSASLHDELILDRLTVHWADTDIRSSGHLQLSPPQRMEWVFRASGEYEIQAEATGRLQDFSLSLTTASPDLEMTADGRIRNVLTRPSWDLDITTPMLQWPLGMADPDALLRDAELHFSGEWQSYRAELSGQLEMEGISTTQLHAEGTGEELSFTLGQLKLTGPELVVEASGSLTWEDGPTADIAMQLQRLELSHWLAQWPADLPLQGRVEAGWSRQHLTLPAFSFTTGNSAMRIEGSGDIDLQQGVVDGQIGWLNLQWPPGSEEPDIFSERGSIAIDGQPTDWRMQGSLTVRTPDLPQGELRLQGSGDQDAMQLTLHEGQLLGGRLSGDLAFNWTGARHWSVSLAAERLDITSLLPRFGAVVDTQFNASGQFEPFGFNLVIERLNGTRNGRQLAAEGGLQLSGKHWSAERLDIRYADASLSLDGGLFDPDGLAFSVDIPALGRLSQDFGGSLAGNGNLSLAAAVPRLSAELSGQNIEIGPLRIKNLRLDELPGEGGEAGSELLLEGLLLGTRPLERVTLRSSGAELLQRIHASAVINDSSLELALVGSVRDWTRPLGAGWSGNLTELRLSQAGRFDLRLEEPAALSVQAGQMHLEASCFNGLRGGRLCGAADWNEAGGLAVNAEMKAVPLALLELLPQGNLEYSQMLSGEFDWRHEAGGGTRGDARIEISPGVIRVADDSDVLLETGPGRFGFSISGKRLQRGHFELELPAAGRLDLDFSVPSLEDAGDSELQGKIRIDLNDIGFAGQVLPFFDRTGGALAVDLELGGSLMDPTYSGAITMRDGRLDHSASGLSLQEIELSGTVSQLDHVELSGRFRAGEGRGELAAHIDFADLLSPRLELEITGQKLNVIDVPDLKMVTDPDMKLAWHQGLLEIDGRLAVPFARLSPKYLPVASVTESEDVVVVAGEAPQREKNHYEKGDYQIHGSLIVALGDNVRLDLDLVEAKVRGETLFTWQGPLVPMADGNYELSGKLQAYGQLLEITRGRIAFPDVPADNPNLNIRAERQIYGNTLIRTAGIMIEGTLERPLIEAYTVPATNTQRAQTLLVTGSEFDYEQGVGAVAIGTYIAPRLYISYGIGVFEEGNILTARYDLKKGFGIKATTGDREAGVDLNYTIER
ncbi:MAG: translocation/assembly module TamB domain-containing protein, partial [Xanthomonadales bacterium]|nr:translocation/assembly module TamB domain-containing protein [Xanthomonadales bacterium]